jgi:hypothetical protein
MSEFRSDLIVEVEEVFGMFELVKPLVYYSDLVGAEIIVPATFQTDFASIPWFLHSLIQVNGAHRRAAVVHDYLCVYGKELGIKQSKADRIFLEAMKVLGVRWTQRTSMFIAVRIYQTLSGLIP